MRLVLLPILLAFAWIVPVHAQPLTDTTLTWQSYARMGTAAVAVYPTPVDDERYARVVVLRELAANEGPSILDDASFLAEHVGRTLGFDPVEALWIYHWGSFSFAGAADARKDVLLRATYRRTSRGALGAPSWRVMTRAEVEEATDRRFP